MARPKARWVADWRHVGLHSCGPVYVVHIGCELPREPGRIVDIHLAPERAESLGNSLLEYAAKVRELNASRKRG